MSYSLQASADFWKLYKVNKELQAEFNNFWLSWIKSITAAL